MIYSTSIRRTLAVCGFAAMGLFLASTKPLTASERTTVIIDSHACPGCPECMGRPTLFQRRPVGQPYRIENGALRRVDEGALRRPGQLPRGRRYLNGRYFGNFNNRFYGPQYGYF